MKIKLVFKGKLVPDISREDALKGVAALVKQPVDVVEKQLFAKQSVTIKTVKSQAEAQKFVDAFARAGIELEVQTVPPPAAAGKSSADKSASENGSSGSTSPGIAAPKKAASDKASNKETSPEQDSPKKASRKSPLLVAGVAAMALLLLVGAGAAWYLQPVWRANATSEAMKSAVAALASDDLVALAHVDIRRAIQLQERLYGEQDTGALLQSDEDTWDSLAAAGIDPGKQFGNVLVALHVDEDRADWSLVALGTPDAAAVRQWISANYDVERTDAQTGTVYFSWVDENTCEPSGLHAARTGPDWVVVAAADRFDALWSRLEQRATPPAQVDTWLSLADKQLLTAGIFNPQAISKAADGIAGMMLAAAGEAASPADGLYLGVSPTLMPPGASLQGTIASADAGFLDTVESAATSWLAETKSSAADMSPDVIPIIDRIFVLREGGNLTAGVSLDTNFGDELGKLVGAVAGQAFQVSMQGSGPMEEQVKESPMTFANVTAAQIGDFDQYGDAFFDPQWQDGPFAIGVSRLVSDSDGQLLVTLRGEGRGLPNVGERSALVRFRVTDALDSSGASILPEQSCGPIRNTQWIDDNHVSMGSYFQGTDISFYPSVSMEKELLLAVHTDPGDIQAIQGEIEFFLPTQVKRVVVDSPSAADVIEADDVRISFKAASESGIDYQLSGDRKRLLAVRALNDRGQVLESGSSSRSDVWFGSGENVSIDYYGTVAAAEVILAETLEPVRYRFRLPGAYPAIDADNLVMERPVEVATASALSRSMSAPAPAVTFDYMQPMSTTSAGPALLSLGQMQASSFMGLTAQMDLYVSNRLPLEYQLNGASIALDEVHFADGTSDQLDLAAPAALEPDGGYWMNGEYQYDENKPWLKSSVYLQDSDYDADMPVAASGRIVFRAVDDAVTVTMLAAPGQRFDEHGIAVEVNEWRKNGLVIDVADGAERVISVTALDADGQPVGRSDGFSVSGSEVSIDVDLNGVPERLELMVALELEEIETPFRIDLDGSN